MYRAHYLPANKRYILVTLTLRAKTIRDKKDRNPEMFLLQGIFFEIGYRTDQMNLTLVSSKMIWRGFLVSGLSPLLSKHI
jgi:hypothetical protein